MKKVGLFKKTMKTLRTILIASLATVFFSCGNYQKAITTTSNEPSSTDNDIDIYWAKLNKNDWIKLKKKDMTAMYEYVDMSEDQIQKYHREYVGYIDDMQNKHIRKTFVQKDLLKMQERILYKILMPEQYNKYQDCNRKGHVTKL